MSQNARQRLILALDGNDRQQLEGLVHALKDQVLFYKVGCWGFTAWGPDFIKFIRQNGGEVFLDLKFHDIPHTVAGAVVEAARLGVYFLTMHSVGGMKMMAESVQKVNAACKQEGLRKPKLLAITVLTSMDQSALQESGVSRPLHEQVLHLARMAQEAGMDGVVASPLEVQAIRQQCGDDFLIVTPGVRPATQVIADDQQRVLTPQQAIEQGSDYLVIGRPITQAPNPVEAAEEILRQMSAGLK